jgi:Electron transfer DM13
MSMTGRFARHRGAVLTLAVALVAAVVFGIYWFAPQRLFIDRRVSETLPSGPAASSEEGIRLGQANRGGASEQGSGEGASERDTGQADGPAVLAEGHFRSLEHESSGRALVLRLPDGRQFLRLEDLDTSDGPDLRVYLSAAAATSGHTEFGREFVDLGALKGNQGDQNYEIPAGVNIDRFESAVVWCRRFAVGFAAAPIT